MLFPATSCRLSVVIVSTYCEDDNVPLMSCTHTNQRLHGTLHLKSIFPGTDFRRLYTFEVSVDICICMDYKIYNKSIGGLL